jgi:flagellar hook-associated protein 1 FlgK
VRLSENHAPVGGGAGELPGVLQGRDQVLGGFIDQLDGLTSNMIFEFNRIHSSGEGLKGFTSLTSADHVSSTTAALNAAGLAFSPQHGSFQVKLVNQATGLAETSNIAIDLDGIGPDTTLDDLRAMLDGVNNLDASITSDGRLKLATADGYELRFANDTSGTLAALGLNTFFTGSDSGNIGVNSVVLSDNAYFASGTGGGPADGSNSVKLAQLSTQSLGGLGNLSLDQYYDQMIGSVAQSSSAESALAEGVGGFRDSLLNQREQISGVSLDEEAIRIMEFQHAYQSAARIISTASQLLDTLMQL